MYETSTHSGQAALSKQVCKFKETFNKLSEAQQYQISKKIIATLPSQVLSPEEQQEYIKKVKFRLILSIKLERLAVSKLFSVIFHAKFGVCSPNNSQVMAISLFFPSLRIFLGSP